MPPRRLTPQGKPRKPYPDFPLYAHAAGVWAKKIRGRVHYFGKWADWKAALAEYDKQKDALHSGKAPKSDPDDVTVKDVANAFLIHKKERLDSGELSSHTYAKYEKVVEQLRPLARRAVTDLGAADFASLRKRLAERSGPYRLADLIQHIRSVFKHAYDAGLIDRPVRFGPGFARPTKKVMRLHRAQQGKKMFQAHEIRRMIDAASPTVRAMILLGINCGFGNEDCARLTLQAVDLKHAVIEFPRPKTGFVRLCPLWPETAAALQDCLARRIQPRAEADAGLFFVTARGNSFRMGPKRDQPITQVMTRLLRRLAIRSHAGQGFYSLRRTFRTVADEVKDQPAADFIMGHGDESMAGFYRQDLSLDRLRAVVEHVRHWLFPSALKIHAAS